jgi:hypothetical protein
MKTKKVLFKVMSVLLFLCILSLSSCVPEGCTMCENLNGEHITACSAAEISEAMSMGYMCD